MMDCTNPQCVIIIMNVPRSDKVDSYLVHWHGREGERPTELLGRSVAGLIDRIFQGEVRE